MLNGRLAWPGLGLAWLFPVGGVCGVSSWGVAMSGVIKTLARGGSQTWKHPVKLRQRRVLCVCYACQAVCTREGGQPALLKCGGGAGVAVLSNDISILISLGVIVKCLPAARRRAKMLIMVSILVFTFPFYSRPIKAPAGSPRHKCWLDISHIHSVYMYLLSVYPVSLQSSNLFLSPFLSHVYDF